LSSVKTTGIDQFIVMFQALFEKETELILPLKFERITAIFWDRVDFVNSKQSL